MNQYVKCPFCVRGYAHPGGDLTKCGVCGGSENAEITGFMDKPCYACCDIKSKSKKRACKTCNGGGVLRHRVFRGGRVG